MKKIIENIIKKIRYNYLKTKGEIIGHYRMEDLETKNELIIKANTPLSQIKNFIYIKEDALIKFTFHPQFENKDERPYYDKLREIFKILEKHNRTYNISIYVENRELFKQSKALEHTSNINLIIHSDLNDYTKEEYIEEEKTLNSLVESIKNSNLSPYEKYLAVYNIVKQFKEYKENREDPYKSRYIKEILKNEYMVCVGFSNLLTTLLDRIGIPCVTISAFVEDQELTEFMPFEYRPVLLAGHERNIIKIDDDKYNIHGIYLADATWDNHTKADLYNNSSITYDKLKEARSLEKMRVDDCFFDVHSFDEFNQKMNIYLKREIKREKRGTYKEKVIKAYRHIYRTILKLLYKLDYNKWLELTEKYDELIDNIDKVENSLKSIESIYEDFLTEFGYYIINYSNKEIDINTIFDAAINVKKAINGYNDGELKKWENITETIYEEIEKQGYPYQYNPYNKRMNYLETKEKIKCRVRKI